MTNRRDLKTTIKAFIIVFKMQIQMLLLNYFIAELQITRLVLPSPPAFIFHTEGLVFLNRALITGVRGELC